MEDRRNNKDKKIIGKEKEGKILKKERIRDIRCSYHGQQGKRAR